jgi:NADH-quinone oxidoreductase subunit J
MDAFFFWFFSAGMIGFGLAVILNRNPVASALSFAFSIIFMSGLFILLSAFFLAAVQVLVTAGAVMVLFLFIIMLLNPEAMEHMPRPKLRMVLTALLGLGFIFLVARTLQDVPEGKQPLADLAAENEAAPADPAKLPIADQEDDTHRIGRLLFSTYVAPFEATSLLILVATIGVIVLCKQEPAARRGPPSADADNQPAAKPREPELVR